jgi:hypothetical protein
MVQSTMLLGATDVAASCIQCCCILEPTLLHGGIEVAVRSSTRVVQSALSSVKSGAESCKVNSRVCKVDSLLCTMRCNCRQGLAARGIDIGRRWTRRSDRRVLFNRCNRKHGDRRNVVMPSRLKELPRLGQHVVFGHDGSAAHPRERTFAAVQPSQHRRTVGGRHELVESIHPRDG